MSTLHRKLLRDIVAGKARFFAVTFLVFLSLCLFLSTWLSYRSLDHSYSYASEELKYNDIIIKVAEAPDSVVDGLEGIEGVDAVISRLVLGSGCYLPNGENIVCQLVGMPAGEQPPLNQVLVEGGEYLPAGATNSCLVEVHLSDYYNIAPGATLQVVAPEGKQAMQVEGTAASAEFFIVSTEKTMIATPRNYGVLFVPQNWLQQSFGWEGNSNQFCFRVKEGADAQAVMEAAEKELSQYSVLYASLGDDTEARQLLDLDVEGFREISLFFPILFLIVAALSLYMILTRMVHMQRRQIGTMMALGLGRRRITVHYLSYALLVGVVGAVAGLIVGYFVAGWLTHEYAKSIGIPLVSMVMEWEAVVEGLVVALAACFLSSILPIRRLLKLKPAVVMQEEIGEGKVLVDHVSLIERIISPLYRLKATWKMPLRNLSRNRRRALLNIMGITFAFMLVLVSMALLDSMDDAFSFYYNDFVRYDANVYFSSPVPLDDASGLSGISAVKGLEPYLMVPCKFQKAGDTLGEGLLRAVPQNSDLLGLYGTDGQKMQLPDQGALLANWFRDGLGVKVGDTVKVVTSVGSMDMKVEGFVKQIGGLAVFANLSWVQQTAGTDLVNGLLVASSGSQGDELRDDLMQIPGAAGVEITEFTEEMMRDEMMGMMYIFAGMMILFAVAMALALVYNTISIAYLEREKEISVMLALGSRMKLVTGVFTVENLIVAVIAVIPGVLAGYGLSVLMMKLFSNEFFSAPAVIRGASYAVTILGVLLVVLLAELPSLRRAGRINLADIIRDRSR
ncbi:MAG: FtsX-like permease family protein [Actinomycetota bacterium]|nr:FtsX-like permease family protein [Actinomycetota bacterium]